MLLVGSPMIHYMIESILSYVQVIATDMRRTNKSEFLQWDVNCLSLCLCMISFWYISNLINSVNNLLFCCYQHFFEFYLFYEMWKVLFCCMMRQQWILDIWTKLTQNLCLTTVVLFTQVIFFCKNNCFGAFIIHCKWSIINTIKSNKYT